jgi:hypothetical protein
MLIQQTTRQYSFCRLESSLETKKRRRVDFRINVSIRVHIQHPKRKYSLSRLETETRKFLRSGRSRVDWRIIDSTRANKYDLSSALEYWDYLNKTLQYIFTFLIIDSLICWQAHQYAMHILTCSLLCVLWQWYTSLKCIRMVIYGVYLFKVITHI